MPRKLFIQSIKIELDDDYDWSFLQYAGQMNSNIIKINKIMKQMEICTDFISLGSNENNKYFHLLKGETYLTICNL
jgi:hypothetical protein